MKVAFVNQPMDGVLPAHQNSIGIWTYQVANRIASDHEIIVYAKQMRTQKKQKLLNRVQYFFIPAIPNRVWDKIAKFFGRVQITKNPFFASTWYYLDYIIFVALHARKQGCEIIHIHNFSQFAPVIRRLNPQAKIVLHMNCEWLSQLDPDLVASRLEKIDLILGSSNYITEKIKRRFPQFSHRCQTIYNGVDAARFTSNEHQAREIKKHANPKHILFVGRVSPEKGVHTLLDAFPQIAERFAKVQLNIVGHIEALPRNYIVALSDEPDVQNLAAIYDDGSHYSQYLQRRIPQNLATQVHFHGGMSHEQVISHYHQTDVLVNPSYSESFGMSLVEAMASEKPVVATRVGGMQEIVSEGETGFLVPRGDSTALAKAIIELLDNEELQLTMGKAGRQRVLDLFSWDQVAKALIKRYTTIFKSE